MFEHLPQRSAANRAATPVDDLRADLRYAWRQLRRAPAFSLLVVATLAIGIGANATMAGVIDKLLFRPPPAVPDANALVRFVSLSNTDAGGTMAGGGYTYQTYLDFKDGLHDVDGVTGFMPMDGLGFQSNDPSSELNATAVASDFFEVLRVRPIAGSFFGARSGYPTSAQSGGPAFVVLGFAFWQRQFGGSRDILGKTLHIGKGMYTVIGVAPPEFRGVESTARDAWIPITVALELEQPQLPLAGRGLAYFQVIARMRAGASRDALTTQATAINLPYSVFPTSFDQHPRVIAAPIVRGRGPDAPHEVRLTLWLGGISAILLLIVCANVANLLLGRAFARRREIAVRLALGASRSRLARQLATEALLLTALGAVAGLYFAAFGARLLQQQFATDVGSGAMIDTHLLFFTACVALGTGILVSLAPMLQSTSPNLTGGLRSSASGVDAGSTRVRHALLAMQAAMCMVLVVGAALFAQSLRRVQSLDLGVDLDHTLQVTLRGAASLSIPDAEAYRLLEEIKHNVAAIPGVRSAALAQGAFSGGRAVTAHRKDMPYDQQRSTGKSRGQVTYLDPADSGMFRTLGAQSLRGRDFEARDVAGAPLVTIINEPLAHELFPAQDALGQCIVLSVNASKLDGDCVEIVGVLRGFNRQGILTRDALVAYVPLAQIRPVTPAMTLYVRTADDAARYTEVVRRTVLRSRPDLRRLTVQTMRAVIAPEVQPWDLAATMFGLFGTIALVIAMIGLYAVVSFSVTQRTREIGIRLALGARALQVSIAIGGGSVASVAGGLSFGVMVVVFVRRWIGPLLFQTSASDPLLISGAALLLMAVAMIAMLVPLNRALGLSPAQVLREG